MLMKAPVDIGSDTGIETIIAADDHVNRPTHGKTYDASFDLFNKKFSKTAHAAPTPI